MGIFRLHLNSGRFIHMLTLLQSATYEGLLEGLPTRCAASSFSFTPPTGMTRPRSEISPVVATSLRTDAPSSSDATAVNIVTPALGPSVGVG